MTVCVVPPPVMDPLVIDHEYDVSPAGPLALCPIEFGQTCASAGVTVIGPLQLTSLKQDVVSLRVGVTVLSVLAEEDVVGGQPEALQCAVHSMPGPRCQ